MALFGTAMKTKLDCAEDVQYIRTLRDGQTRPYPMTSTVPPSLTLDDALRQAIADHHAGRFAEAEQLYRAILQVRPEHAQANHNLGALACLGGQPLAGLPYLKAALAADPGQELYALSYSEALLLAGHASAALAWPASSSASEYESA